MNILPSFSLFVLLIVLLPFYFFRYPLNKLEKDNESIEEMKKTYLQLWDTLEDMVQNQIISELEKSAIKAMCDKVATALSEHYENVKKGVKDFFTEEAGISTVVEVLIVLAIVIALGFVFRKNRVNIRRFRK